MKLKTAKEILYAKARSKNDGFTSGQVGWIAEAMEEYLNQHKQQVVVRVAEDNQFKLISISEDGSMLFKYNPIVS